MKTINQSISGKLYWTIILDHLFKLYVAWFWCGCSDNEREFHERCYHSSNLFSISTDNVSYLYTVFSFFSTWPDLFTFMFSSLHSAFVHSLKCVVTQVNVRQVSTSSKIFAFWSEIYTNFWNKNKLEDVPVFVPNTWDVFSIAGGLEVSAKCWSLQHDTVRL